MKKYFVLAVVSIVSLVACVKEAAEQDVLELVSAETITVPAKGGNSVIELKSKSELKAVPADSWVNAEVIDHFTVKVTVDAYTGDEVRSTSVSITNAASSNPVRVKINQNAVTFTFTPEDHEFEAEGGEYSYEYTSEAPLEVSSDADWFTTEVGEKELVIKADANEAIKARSAEVKWNIGKNKGTFNISQKGAEPTLESEFFKDGKFDDVAAPVMGVSLEYPYTTNSELEVDCDEKWIEAYVEDNAIHINVTANEGEAREGYIYWEVKSSKTLKGSFKVNQKGSFCEARVQPGAYSGDPSSNVTNTIALIVSGKDVASFKWVLKKTADIEGKSEAELLKLATRVFSDDYLGYVNDKGLNLSLTGCDKETPYTLIAIATNKEGDVANFICGTSTLGDYIYDEFTKDDGFKPIPSKDWLYGKYLFLSRENAGNNVSEGFTDRNVLGEVEFYDGESSVDEYGTIFEWVNVSGMWNTYLNSKYTFTNDITKFIFEKASGTESDLLYMEDPEIGDIVEKASSSVVLSNFKIMSKFETSDYLYAGLLGHLAGGVVDEIGTIAFFDTEIYAEELDSDNKPLGKYQYSYLFCTSENEDEYGWYNAYKSYMFVPIQKVPTANIKAASLKAAKIQKEIHSMPRFYYESKNSIIKRASARVRAEENRMFHAKTTL